MFIFPGFNDAHTHLGEAGQEKLNVDLRGCQSLAEMLSRIQTAATKAPAGHWLTGGGWDHTLWKEKVLPTRRDLDKVTGDHPAFLSRVDGHIAIANSAALKAAGIEAKTQMPEGGAIDLDANGEPTGIVRESAQELVGKVIPPPTLSSTAASEAGRSPCGSTSASSGVAKPAGEAERTKLANGMESRGCWRARRRIRKPNAGARASPRR
jgi:predicted amidohydrolase YtcJ